MLWLNGTLRRKQSILSPLRYGLMMIAVFLPFRKPMVLHERSLKCNAVRAADEFSQRAGV